MSTRYTRKQLERDVARMNEQRPELVQLGVNSYYEHTQVYARINWQTGAIIRLEIGTPRECYEAACRYFNHPPRWA